MNARFLAASLALFSAVPALSADVQRSKYVPCPRGMEGQCGDVPGAITSGSAAGETICNHGTMQDRRASAAAWSRRTARAEDSLKQINNAIDGLANTFAPRGKRPPLAELSDYIRNDLLARLLTPTKNQTRDAAACYAAVRVASDNCFYPHCGDPGAIIRNIENLEPSISRIAADLERKRGTLLEGLPTSVTAGTAPNTYNRCAIQYPQYPCYQAMNKSINTLIQATQEAARLTTGG